MDPSKRFVGFSAGSTPGTNVNPFAAEIAEMLGYPAAKLRSKSWDEYALPGAPKMDFIITVCDNAAGEVCPIWPGQPMTAHWGFPDPSSASGSEAEKAAFTADVFRMIERRIRIFTALPLATLSNLEIKTKIDELGRDRSGN